MALPEGLVNEIRELESGRGAKLEKMAFEIYLMLLGREDNNCFSDTLADQAFVLAYEFDNVAVRDRANRAAAKKSSVPA